MRPDLLAEAIDRDVADGVTPVAVVATAGTTLTGAIDPIAPIAEICEARGDLAARRRRVRAARRIGRARPVRRRGARRLRERRRAQVALRPEGLQRGARPRARRSLADVRARAGLPPAPAARAARRRHHPRVLASAPSAEALARFPCARRGAVPRGDRPQPRRGAAPASGGVGIGRTSRRSTRRRTCRSCRSGTRPPRCERPRRPQPGPRRGDPGGRPRVPRVGADRGRGLAPALLRELPDDRRRRDGHPGRRRESWGRGSRRSRRERRRPAARRTQDPRRARAPPARLPRDVGDLERVPKRRRAPTSPGVHGARRRSTVMDRLHGTLGAVDLGRDGGARVRRRRGDQPAHGDRCPLDAAAPTVRSAGGRLRRTVASSSFRSPRADGGRSRRCSHGSTPRKHASLRCCRARIKTAWRRCCERSSRG